MVPFPNGLNSHGWTRPEPGSRDFMSYVGDRDSKLGLSSTPFLNTFTGNWIRSATAESQTTLMRFVLHRPQLNPLYYNTAPDSRPAKDGFILVEKHFHTLKMREKERTVSVDCQA